MDGRYYKYSPQKHNDTTPKTGRIWGKAQLKASSAPVKLIANGTQVLNQSQSGEGHYREAIGKIERFLSFVKTSLIKTRKGYTRANQLRQAIVSPPQKLPTFRKPRHSALLRIKKPIPEGTGIAKFSDD